MLSKNFDERREELVTCQHCGEEIPWWWFEESQRCPECGERVME